MKYALKYSMKEKMKDEKKGKMKCKMKSKMKDNMKDKMRWFNFPLEVTLDREFHITKLIAVYYKNNLLIANKISLFRSGIW